MSKPDDKPAPLAIDRDKLYSRAEVAAIIGKSELFVQHLWDNWSAQDGPRMNFILQSDRGPAKFSSGAHIQQYFADNQLGLGIGRKIAATVLIVAAAAIIVYLIAVVTGGILKDNRLNVAELGLALTGCLFLILVIHPAALDRLNLLKLPGGIEITLEKIQRQQIEQRRELDAFFSILSNLLSLPEKYHLRSLARADEEYTGQSSLREEMFRLKRFGLIDEVEGQKIGDMFDGKKFKLRSFVLITPQGERFIKALDQIES